MAENESRLTEAQETVKKYMLGALGVGVVPLPLVDLAVLSGIQLKMLHSLAKIYDVEFSAQFGKSLIASLAGGGGSISLYGLITPLGRIASMAGMAFFGGASTYAIGRVFIQDLESGGTFLTLDPEKVKSYYAEQFEEGKAEIKKSFSGTRP